VDVKVFRITGKIDKPNDKMPFTIEVKEVKRENAVERVQSELGGRHKAKRFEIKIEKIEEVSNTN
jgi:large subunit ribosomal protein LX